MLHMQHLVIQNVFNDQLRNTRIIKRAAYDDRTMHVVVVAWYAPGSSLAPGELRLHEAAREVAGVEFFEQLCKIVDLAARRSRNLVSAFAPRVMRRFQN